MLRVTWNPMSRVEWLGIVEGMNTKSKRVLGVFLLSFVGLSGKRAINLQLKPNSLDNLPTVFF
jgi:hypothetical protein